MDEHFRKLEQASRLWTSLNTVGTEHFDQVIAVSQGMINHALEKMHQQYSELNEFDGKSTFGTITADLDPCQIIIPAGQELAANPSFVIWRLNFNSGTFTAKTETGDVKYSVNGWSIDIRVPLTFAHLEDKDNDSDAKKASNARQREWIAANFEVPGDYRPERLYAKMSDARWDNVMFAGPSFHANGQKKAYEDWKRLPENIEISAALEHLIKIVCNKREVDGLTNIGTRFKLDDEKTKLPPTLSSYPPVSMVHQAYPYKIGPEAGVSGWDHGKMGIDDPGSRNCLLYCENVDRRKMNGLQMQQGGNFTTIGHPSVAGSRIEGTFALSHQLFFERFLLPHLQPFVMESQIFPSKAEFTNKSDGTYGVWVAYRCGFNPADAKQEASKDIYKFKWVDAKDGQDGYYQAHVILVTDTPPFSHQREWSKHYGEGSPKVTVKWETGGSRVTIQGTTDYQTHITTSKRNSVDPVTHSLLDPRSWWHDSFIVTWNMAIDISVSNGGLNLRLSHDSDFVKVFDNSQPKKNWQWDNKATAADIKRRIDESMTQQLQYFKEVLTKGFSDQLKFLYPGNGQLEFGKAIFNHNGDLLAEIWYKDRPANDAIVLPRVSMITTEPPRTDSSLTGSTVSGSPPPRARLDWSSITPLAAFKKEEAKPRTETKPAPTSAVPSAPTPGSSTISTSSSQTVPATPAEKDVDRRTLFRINGKNPGKDPVYLSKITVTFTGHVNGSELLRSIKFVQGPGGKQDEVELTGELLPSAINALSKPVLEPTPLSRRSCSCEITLHADGGPIIIQPAGVISLIAKSVPGDPIDSSVVLRETWCDEKGNTSAQPIVWEQAIPFSLI